MEKYVVHLEIGGRWTGN